MKIRLTKETLGLPVGTVLEGTYFRNHPSESTALLGMTMGDDSLRIRKDSFEELPEPTEEDRLRERVKELEGRLQALEATQEALDAHNGITNARIGSGRLTVDFDGAWRKIEVGEIIQEGDQYLWIGGEWKTQTTLTGDRLTDGHGWRRRVTPPEPQYRMLDVGEKIEKTDEMEISNIGSGGGKFSLWTGIQFLMPCSTYTGPPMCRIRRRVG